MTFCRWAVGVTTVPARATTLLPRTLASLKEAGFPEVRLFIDGAPDSTQFQHFGIPCTFHYPAIRTYGNWVLGLAEIFIREPACDYYFMCQDDFVTYRNLKGYLERCVYPPTGYWNLYTFPVNHLLSNGRKGWYESNQMGRGAVALVFSRKAVTTLLVHQHIVERPMDANRGWRAIDGGIVTAFQKAGWKEWVHNPSLVQHTGEKSSMGNGPQQLAPEFRGEGFDALELLKEQKVVV